MDWIAILTIIGANITLAAGMFGICWAMHRENAKETKDFHGRLCTLEERYLQMMQRILERKDK